MKPEIEPMLEDALGDITPSLPGVSRVSVEPDYESGLDEVDLAAVRTDLLQLLRGAGVDPEQVQTHDGQSLPIEQCQTLRRFVRRVALHGGAEPERPWVDVTPPGNWI